MKKNITRRLTTALLAAVMCVSMAACGSKTDDTKTDGTGDADGAKKYTIGVCQLVTHDALDAATQGFIDAVKDKLGEENVTIDVQNAANDQNVCTTIVNTFVSKKVDLIMANGTDRAMEEGSEAGAADFALGKAAMFVQGTWASNTIMTTNPDMELGVFALPINEDPNCTRVNLSTSTTLGVHPDSKELDLALKFANYVLDAKDWTEKRVLYLVKTVQYTKEAQ